MKSYSRDTHQRLACACTRLVAYFSVAVPCLLASTGSAVAGTVIGAPLEQIEGFKNAGQIASPHVIFVSFGPSLPDSELKRRHNLLPQWVAGAGYRVAFVGQDKYVDLVIELIASGEEGSPKMTVSSHWLSGSDIEQVIGAQDFNVVSLKKWIDYRTLLVEGGSVGSSPAQDIKKEFTVTIHDSGVFDVDLALKGRR